jgi:formate-dependent nitrite reductase cytochrome c552 subunit
MRRRALALLALGIAAGLGGGAAVAQQRAGAPGASRLAQGPQLHPLPPDTPNQPRGRPAQGVGELDCRGCHLGKHQGVFRMYLGTGGRGTPMIPSHMFQVRVECVACHIVPKESEATAGLVGQTFRPSEQACLNCHGEKYRGMLGRWADTLGKMRDVVAPKLAAARAALPAGDAKDGKVTRGRSLVNDAEYNVQFVALGHGVHNVFYAADLLKLSNSWLDEALALLGKPPVKNADALVRGGYCAVLCHETAGVKQRETVTFRKQAVPHVRHVTEFGATCTACHSAEVHKAVTATPATCGTCHHGAQNERCESCHRAQSAFYRGQETTSLVKLEPNAMATAVGCTGCHDWSRKHSRKAVAGKCVGCHDAAYTGFLDEWTTGFDKAATAVRDTLRRAETALARQRRGGRAALDADAAVTEARGALALIQKARGVHNPPAAEALLQVARKKAEEALARSAQP